MKSFALKNLSMIQEAIDSSAIVAITDARGNIKWVNDMFCKISGYSKEELMGQNHRILKSGHHSPQFYRKLWKDINSGKKWVGEIKNRRKDGEFYWVKTYIHPFQDDQTGEKEYVSIRWDITDQKDEEENVSSLMDASIEALLIYDLNEQVVWCNKKATQDLETSLTNRFLEEVFQKSYAPFQNGHQEIRLTEPSLKVLETLTKPFHWKGHRCFLLSLQDITQRIQTEAQMIQQDRLSSVGLMAAGLAHEVGTPLGVIRARAELAERQMQNPEKLKSHLTVIQEQIDRVSHLIRSLLDLSRSSPSQNLDLIPIHPILTKLNSFLSYELKKNQVDLKMEVPEDTKVYADPDALFQVLLNLVMNALQAFEVNHSSREISIYKEEGRGLIQLYIKDNGPGIRPEDLKQIFVPFFTTKAPGKGTGLGLVVSRKMVRSWGGDLTLSSNPDGGTLVTLSFLKHKLSSE